MILVIVLSVIFVIFILLYLLTASRIRMMPIYGGGDALDSIFSFFHAGDNIFTKYLRYCYNILFHFDFGRSGTMGYRLMIELKRRIRTTVIILASGVGATLIFGIPVGVFTSVHKNRLGDRALNTVFLILSSIPNYAMALGIALVLAVYLRIIPLISDSRKPIAYLMPMLTIALGGISSIARMTRASMIEVLEQPYITALRAKGLKEVNVICRHALKNALVPIISALGVLISQLLCGTLVVEYFFNVPGLGSYLLRSVGMRDHYEILGCTVFMTIILAVMNIVADVLYASINPQIRLRYKKAGKRMSERNRQDESRC